MLNLVLRTTLTSDILPVGCYIFWAQNQHLYRSADITYSGHKINTCIDQQILHTLGTKSTLVSISRYYILWTQSQYFYRSADVTYSGHKVNAFIDQQMLHTLGTKSTLLSISRCYILWAQSQHFHRSADEVVIPPLFHPLCSKKVKMLTILRST